MDSKNVLEQREYGSSISVLTAGEVMVWSMPVAVPDRRVKMVNDGNSSKVCSGASEAGRSFTLRVGGR